MDKEFQAVLIKIREDFKWTWDNMGKPHSSDHFNIPANGIQQLDDLINIPLPPPVATERILCAAIWYKEIPLVNAEVLEGRGFKPYNADKGAVVCGWRHANCILLKSALTGLKDSECGEHEQGFLTDKNRFVSREEAAKIALVSGQIIKEIKTLFSEDLY